MMSRCDDARFFIGFIQTAAAAQRPQEGSQTWNVWTLDPKTPLTEGAPAIALCASSTRHSNHCVLIQTFHVWLLSCRRFRGSLVSTTFCVIAWVSLRVVAGLDFLVELGAVDRWLF